MEDSRTEIDTSRMLIQLVKSKPCLWDRSVSEYRNRVVREKAWRDICSHIEPTFESLDATEKEQFSNQIMKKWYNIRDSYVKSLKNKGLLSKSRRNKHYIYSESLTFLHQHISPTTYTSSNHSVDEKMSNDEEEISEHWLDQVYIDVDENTAASKRPKIEPDLNPQLNSQEVENDCNIITVLAKLIQKEEDEDRAFFKSIIPAVKELSVDSKFVFRIKVMQLLRDLKMKERKPVDLKVQNSLSYDTD